MGHWKLIDGREPVDDPHSFPTAFIESEAQLRAELLGLVRCDPGIVALVSPERKRLQIGIGGPLAGIRWSERSLQRGGIAQADRVYTDRRVDFAAEGDTIAFWPEELMPVEQAIEVIVSFYQHGQLPDWVAWKEWDPVSKQWIKKAAVGSPPVTEQPPPGNPSVESRKPEDALR